jgi:DNA primase catalytic core
MYTKLANLDEVMENLRGFLPQYLEQHGIDAQKNFKCINPKHEDTGPSMSCKQNPKNAYCFGCNITADIFQAAHWLDGKPITGPGWIDENIKYLADKFGVQVQLAEMSEEELYRYRTYCAYRDAAGLIAHCGKDSKLFVDEVKRRNWDRAALIKSRVGSIPYKDFREAMKNMGYEPRFQDEIDLGRLDIFDESNMIFTICDEWGRPVGFAARNLNYTDEKDENGQPKNGSKYTNQKTTGLRCNIYQKGRRLYEIHTATKYTPPLFLFEGYADVITAQQAGLFNCAGVGGTSLTSEHIDLLKGMNIYDIVLAFDSDAGGQDTTARILEKGLAGHKDLNVWVLKLPSGMDPDDFIREKGLDEFLKLKRWSAFEWRLSRFKDDDDPELVCKTMIPLIVNESSRITQDKQCAQLSRFTGVDKKVIHSELERLMNEKEHHRTREKSAVLERGWNEIQRNPDDAKALLEECLAQIQQVDEKYDDHSMSEEGCIQFVQGIKEYEEAQTGEFAGFHLSPLGLGGLGDVLNGNWREDSFLCFGGSANSGKTSMLCQMAFEIATDPRNNACVIYHTIDDSAAQLLPRFVVHGYGLPDLTLNEIRNPNYYVKYKDNPLVVERRERGYREVLRLVKDGRIILKDSNDGASFAYGESLIKYYKKKYPERNVIYILDNLHKTPDYPNLETRVRFKTLSNHMKGVAVKYHIAVIATVEYVKLPPGIIPNNNNIAETRAIIYDASFIGHLYNDLHEMSRSAICVHRTKDGDLLPRIRLGIGKNKITDFKDRVFLDFYPASGMFRCVATSIAEDEMVERRKLLKSGGDSDRRIDRLILDDDDKEASENPQWPGGNP